MRIVKNNCEKKHPITMGKGMKILMTYHIAEGVEDGKMIKLEAKDADGNISKEELPIFNNNSPQERCLILLKELLAIADRCS